MGFDFLEIDHAAILSGVTQTSYFNRRRPEYEGPFGQFAEGRRAPLSDRPSPPGTGETRTL